VRRAELISLEIFFPRRNTDVVPKVIEKKSITHISILVVPPVLKIWIEEYARRECTRMVYKIATIVYAVLIPY
jgi:non-ribosomal peptide synthetase component E (peptide arylation enzyme)